MYIAVTSGVTACYALGNPEPIFSHRRGAYLSQRMPGVMLGPRGWQRGDREISHGHPAGDREVSHGHPWGDREIPRGHLADHFTGEGGCRRYATQALEYLLTGWVEAR